jgi:hypothetical protein
MGATPALGPIHTAQGIVETPSHPILGPLHAAAGALETATLPSGFMAPQAAETAASLPGKLTDLIPSAAHAGENFNAVKEAVGSHPIDMTDALSNSTMAVQKLADTGGSMPMVVRKFLTRITNPDAPPLTYDDARLFYSNASRLSADEQQRLTPVVRRAVGQFVSDLGDSIAGVAERGGKLQQFQDAMQEYRNAMRLRDVGENVKNAAIEGAKRAIPAAGVYYGIKKLLSGPSVGK